LTVLIFAEPLRYPFERELVKEKKIFVTSKPREIIILGFVGLYTASFRREALEVYSLLLFLPGKPCLFSHGSLFFRGSFACLVTASFFAWGSFGGLYFAPILNRKEQRQQNQALTLSFTHGCCPFETYVLASPNR